MRIIFMQALALILIFFLWIVACIALSKPANAEDIDSYYASLSSSNRSDSFSSSAGFNLNDSFYVDASFIDEGRQPNGIKNINRLVNLDLSESFHFKSFYLSVKAGLTSSYFSHNGSGNSYDNHTGFTGENIGVAVGYNVSKFISVELSDSASRYLQSDHRAFETFNFLSIGLNVKF